MVKKRGLGKSLDALLAYKSTETVGAVEFEDNTENQTQERFSKLPVHQIQKGKYQPRHEMDQDSLEELANSIRSQGIIQPLIVRPLGDKYEIIAGERRWRAAQLAGLTEVPVVIRHIPDEAAIAIALIENIQRENLNPIEEAIAIERLIKEFGMTHQQASEAVGKSRTSITNLLRLLVLPEEVKDMLERGIIEMGHARALITLPQASQIDAANIIMVRRLSVRQTEQLVRQMQSPPNKQDKSVNPDVMYLQENLSRQLKCRVAIHCNAKGKGKLVIHYRNLRELDQLVSQFQTE